MNVNLSGLTRFILLVALFCLSLGGNSRPVGAQDLSGQADASGRFLIGLADGVAVETIAGQVEASGWQIGRVWPDLGLVELTPSPNSPLNAAQFFSGDAPAQQLAFLSELAGVAFAEPDAQVFAATRDGANAAGSPSFNIPQEPTPDDPLVGQQWAIPRLEVLDGWSITQGDGQVVVALIDSGYDVEHEDIDETTVWVNPLEAVGAAGVDDDANGFVDDLHGWDWVENDATTNDPYGHGTHVGATIAAATNNQLGVAGLGRSLHIMPLRILDRSGGGSVSDLVDAINYARKYGAKIINLSLVMSTPSQALQTAVRQATGDGLILVAASGNSNRRVSWPAAFPETVAVGATDRDDVRATFSNYGPELDLAAPGVEIISAYRGGYHNLSGTSMATPHVSALAGLVWSLRPDLDDTAVIDLLRAAAVDVNADEAPGPDDFVGAGRIDYAETLRRASADLVLRPTSAAANIVFAGEPVVYTLNVTTPPAKDGQALPVSGAVMNYSLTPEVSRAENTPLLTGRALSDVDGQVTLAFLAPAVRSSSHLSAAVGLAQMNAELFVQIPPAQIALTGPTESLPAGDAPVTLHVDLRDADGQLATGPMPMRLEAQRGVFENGESTIELVVTDGAADISFRPGSQSGPLLVQGFVGALSGALTLAIEAQTASQLTILAAPQAAGAGTTVEVVFGVSDGLGNPVADGAEVRVFSSVGAVNSSNRTTNGRVAAQITLPEHFVGLATVWAVAPGTRLQERVEFPVSYQLWFPVVAR
jgi:hypothetical protein